MRSVPLKEEIYLFELEKRQKKQVRESFHLWSIPQLVCHTHAGVRALSPPKTDSGCFAHAISKELDWLDLKQHSRDSNWHPKGVLQAPSAMPQNQTLH